MNENETGEDGRNYFRLQDTIGVACYVVTDSLDTYHDPYDGRLDVPPILSLLNQSREAQIDNNNLLKQIRAKNGNVGRYLERLNDRLDFLQKAILYIDHSFPQFSWQGLHYSEAGIDFLIPHSQSQHPSPLAQPTQLKPEQEIHLILAIPAADQDILQSATILPKDHFVYHRTFSPAGYASILGRVSSITDETSVVRVGCAFETITDYDRQFLARHILAVQSFRRRQRLNED